MESSRRSVIVASMSPKVVDGELNHSPMDEASSTTGDDLEIISSEDIAHLNGPLLIKYALENVEPPVMEIGEFRNANLNIKYTRDMVPKTNDECSQLLLEVLVSHHDVSASYRQLLGEHVTKHQSLGCYPGVNL